MKHELIKDWYDMEYQREKEDDTDCYIFCETHLEQGKEYIKKYGKSSLKAKKTESQRKEAMAQRGKKQMKMTNYGKAVVEEQFTPPDEADASESEEYYDGTLTEPTQELSVSQSLLVSRPSRKSSKNS